MFKKNPKAGVLEVSKLIDSAISKRQGDQTKHNFLEKEIFHKREKMEKWINYELPEISHHLMDRAMKQSTHQFHKILFHISKCLACNVEKTLQLKITKKRMKYIHIYIYIYI